MKKFFILVTWVIISAVIAGCGITGPTLPTKYVQTSIGKYESINTPKLDFPVTAELGQPLILRSKTLTTPAIRLEARVFVATQNRGVNFTVEIPPGILKKFGENNDVEFYKAEGMTSTFTVLGSTRKINQIGGVYVPRNQLTPVTAYWMTSDLPNTALTTAAPYATLTKTPDVIEVSSENFKRELLYTGISKNVISIVYREYVNDMARPAFSQELKYDLGEGSIIGFKGARFEVVKATNLGITYRVMAHLD